MGSFADHWENEILDHLFGKGVYNPPTIYVGLSTADPGDDAAGLAEPSGGSYARKVTAETDWDAASGGATANAAAIAFAAATGSWGECTHFALFDALSGGNMLGHGTLSVPKTITSGDTPSFGIGDIEITLA